MPSIIAYHKASDNYTTYQLSTPPDAACPELCTLDGVTYVSMPDGVTLPDQPAQIAASVAVVVPDAALRAQLIAASTQCQLIDAQMRDQIRAAYPLEDELKFARIGVGAAMGMYAPTSDEVQGMTVFGEFVESIRQWGRDQREALGL